MSVRILHLEDDQIQADFTRKRLRFDGLVCEIEVVATEAKYRAALERGGFDVILSDYELPPYDGARALALAQEMHPDVPVIIVSGAIGEDLAVDLVRAGATDYILKQNLVRLAPAIQRALDEADARRERRLSEERLARMNECFLQFGVDPSQNIDRLESLKARAGGDEEFLGIIASAVGIEAGRRRALEETLRARDAAEAGSRAKTEFLANMGHELRTPLSGVIGMTELLSMTELTEEQREYVDAARGSAMTLLRVIDEVLELSSVEGGALTVRAEELALRATLDEVALSVAGRVAEKSLDLLVEVEALVPGRVIGDAARLRQVLTILLDNAVKFTARGGIAVRAGSAGAGKIRFEVSDTGIGISAEGRDRLFRSFSQVESHRSRAFGGIGLGLARAKRIVEAMGGEIGVDSVVGKGSLFWFTARLDPALGRPVAATATA